MKRILYSVLLATLGISACSQIEKGPASQAEERERGVQGTKITIPGIVRAVQRRGIQSPSVDNAGTAPVTSQATVLLVRTVANQLRAHVDSGLHRFAEIRREGQHDNRLVSELVPLEEAGGQFVLARVSKPFASESILPIQTVDELAARARFDVAGYGPKSANGSSDGALRIAAFGTATPFSLGDLLVSISKIVPATNPASQGLFSGGDLGAVALTSERKGMGLVVALSAPNTLPRMAPITTSLQQEIGLVAQTLDAIHACNSVLHLSAANRALWSSAEGLCRYSRGDGEYWHLAGNFPRGQTYQDGEATCASLSVPEFTGFRLPDLNEAVELVNHQGAAALLTSPELPQVSSTIRTSTPSGLGQHYVVTASGKVESAPDKSDQYRVVCLAD